MDKLEEGIEAMHVNLGEKMKHMQDQQDARFQTTLLDFYFLKSACSKKYCR